MEFCPDSSRVGYFKLNSLYKFTGTDREMVTSFYCHWLFRVHSHSPLLKTKQNKKKPDWLLIKTTANLLLCGWVGGWHYPFSALKLQLSRGEIFHLSAILMSVLFSHFYYLCCFKAPRHYFLIFNFILKVILFPYSSLSV